VPESTPSVPESTPYVLESTPYVLESTPSVLESTPYVLEFTPSVLESKVGPVACAAIAKSVGSGAGEDRHGRATGQRRRGGYKLVVYYLGLGLGCKHVGVVCWVYGRVSNF
jgi:hypothetical protein